MKKIVTAIVFFSIVVFSGIELNAAENDTRRERVAPQEFIARGTANSDFQPVSRERSSRRIAKQEACGCLNAYYCYPENADCTYTGQIQHACPRYSGPSGCECTLGGGC